METGKVTERSEQIRVYGMDRSLKWELHKIQSKLLFQDRKKIDQDN